MTLARRSAALFTSLPLLPLVLLAGCGDGILRPAPSATVSAAAQAGNVHGGQQPVAGATIQLWAAGDTDGGAATALLATPVTTDSGGGFNIPGPVDCSSATEIYITATGGDPGLGQNNPQIAMMGVLGTCDQLHATPFISISELSTVAAVARLAPYMSSYSAVGATAADLPQLQAAFSDAALLVGVQGGSPGPGLPEGATVDTTLIDTLGNILASCVNSGGGALGDGSPCGLLFTATSHGGSVVNTDTAAAMLEMAREPLANVQNLVYLQSPTSPFQPSYSTAPATLSVQVMRAALVALPDYNFFGIVDEGYAYTPTITLRNDSSATVAIAGHGVSASTPADFKAGVFNCPSQLAPGASCTWILDLAPTTTVGENGVYVVENSSSVPVLSIPVNSISGKSGGLPAGSQLAFNPSSIQVTATEKACGRGGCTWTGSAAATLVNQTARQIAYSAPVSTGTGATLTGGTCDGSGGTLAAGASCTYTLSIDVRGSTDSGGTSTIDDLTDGTYTTLSYSIVYK